MENTKKKKIISSALAALVFITSFSYGRSKKNSNDTEISSIITQINDGHQSLFESSSLFKSLVFDSFDMVKSDESYDDEQVEEYLSQNKEIDYEEGIDYIKEYTKYLNNENYGNIFKQEKELYTTYSSYEYYNQSVHYFLDTINLNSGTQYYDYIIEEKQGINITQKVTYLFKFSKGSKKPVEFRRSYDITFHDTNTFISVYNVDKIDGSGEMVSLEDTSYKVCIFKDGEMVCDKSISYNKFMCYCDDMAFCLDYDPSYESFSQSNLELAEFANKNIKSFVRTKKYNS